MATALIVDDTQFMRHLLREILERHGFQVLGEAENGKEAVKMYGELSPDFITLDISMPEMDGIEALKAIMQIDPKARAIMVSAVGSKENVLEAIKSGAKNFIVKPFNEKKVMDVIIHMLENYERPVRPAESAPASSFNDLQDKKQKVKTAQDLAEIIDKSMKGRIDLPVLPKVVQGIENVIKKPNLSAKDLAKVIETDAVISIKLISVANSPVYRGTEIINVVSQAISRLGVQETQSIVLAIAKKNIYRSKNNPLKTLMEKSWLHSLACAYSSRSIAEKLGLADVEKLFLMGLIHDIGKAMLFKVLTEVASQIESFNLEDVISVIQETHCTYGAALLERMHFTQDFIQVAESHDKPKYFQTTKKDILIVNLANKLTRKIDFSIHPDEDIEPAQLESAKLLGVDDVFLDHVVEVVKPLMASVATIF